MASKTQDSPRLPLFYRDVQPLSSQIHRSWRLKDGDVAFTSETPFVPLVIGEIAAASRHYPIVFAAGDATPVAVLGLERINLFVSEGRWADDAYVPAYVRRYPFAFMGTPEPLGYALAIDLASDRFIQDKEDGTALFDEDKPSALTRQALAFCDAFQNEAAVTADFSAVLKANDLLVDRRADATLPDGRKLGLDGFQIVDAERFAALDDPTVIAWHRNGRLTLVQSHLSSLGCFSALLARQGARDGAALTQVGDGAEQTSVAEPV